MRYHKLKLLFLRKRERLVFFIMALGMFSTLFVGLFILTNLYKTAELNRQLLKSLSCILLILPEDRTQQKVEQCVNINSEGENKSSFVFKVLETEQARELQKTDPDVIAVLKNIGEGRQAPSKNGANGKDGNNGQNGANGNNGTDGRNGTNGNDGKDGQDGVNGADGREVEFRHNDSKDRVEWRYVGDTDWQVLVKDCELTNTCLP